MLFHSPAFLFVLLPVLLVLLAMLPKGNTRALCLLVFAYIFYSGSEPRFLALLIIASAVDYWTALRLTATEHAARRKLWLAVSITSNLGMLAFFKYGAFFMQATTP